MSRLSTLRQVAASSASACVNTFTPRRVLRSTWVAEPVDLVRQAVSLQAAVLRNGRNLLRATEEVPGLVARAQAIVTAIETLVSGIDAVNTRAARTVDEVDLTNAQAGAAVRGAQQIEKRVNVLIDRCEPLLDALVAIDPTLVRATHDLVAQLQPLLAAMTRLDPDVADRGAELLTRSGPLLDRVDTVVLPLLAELHDAVPDVRDILPVVQRLEPVMVDVETRIAGLPGADRLRRRGEHVIEQSNTDDG